MKSQVTTKLGDTGETTALSGDTYSKAHPIMACVGALDELRAHIALLRIEIRGGSCREAETIAEFLLWLLHVLFLIGATCSDPLNKQPEFHHRPLSEEDVATLEAAQQRLEKHTPLPHAFVVSASNRPAAQADIACTVARRFERELVRLKERLPEFDTGVALPFVNRLSDYLFVLARFLENGQHQTLDYGVLDAPLRY